MRFEDEPEPKAHNPSSRDVYPAQYGASRNRYYPTVCAEYAVHHGRSEYRYRWDFMSLLQNCRASLNCVSGHWQNASHYMVLKDIEGLKTSDLDVFTKSKASISLD